MKVRNMGASSPAKSGAGTLLGKGLVLSGEVNFSGGLQVDGNVKGSLKASGDSEPGQLIVGETGQVEGNIDAPEIVINGTVKGNVYSTKSINLGITAVIDGDISYQNLEISRGAVVNGKLLRNVAERETAVPEVAFSSSQAS
ncbi:polymer-forming cytoskeletal protein [Pseudomonadota bacterium]